MPETSERVGGPRERLADLLRAYGRIYGFATEIGSTPDMLLDHAMKGLLLPTWQEGPTGDAGFFAVNMYHPDDRHAHILVVTNPDDLLRRAWLARDFGVRAGKLLRLRKLYWEVPHIGPLPSSEFTAAGFELEAQMPARRYHEGEYWDVSIYALFVEQVSL